MRDNPTAAIVRQDTAWLPWLVMLGGALLRIDHFLIGRSLWLDEAMLALNIVERPLVGLLEPLAHNQAAPLGFLLLEKIAVLLLGPTEQALRLVPLLASLAALPVFYGLAHRCLPAPAALKALLLFAISPALVYYAAEAKQYGVDVLVALLLCRAALTHATAPSPRSRVVLALSGAASLWFSHPAVFVLVGAGTLVLVTPPPGERWNRADLAIFALWGTSAAATYLFSLQEVAANRSLVMLWQHGFMPFPPRSWADAAWYPRAGMNLFLAAFVPPTQTDSIAITTASGLGVGAAIIGTLACARHEPKRLISLLLPIGAAMCVSAMGKYPFEGRLLLFAAPTCVLLVAAAGCSQERILRAIATGLFGVLSVALALSLLQSHLHPGREELRQVLVQLVPKLSPKDRVFVHSGALAAFSFYSLTCPPCRIPKSQVIQTSLAFEPEAILRPHEARGTSREAQRVWTVFSHTWSWKPKEEAAWVAFLDSRARRLDRLEASGAAAYLYRMERNDPPLLPALPLPDALPTR